MRLPVVSGREMVKLLTKQGFNPVRQKGDHVSLFKMTGSEPLLVTVPLHNEIKPGTLLSILRQARWTREDLERFRAE